MATIPEDIYANLKRLADERDVSVDDLLRDFINENSAQPQPAMPEWERNLRRKLYQIARDYWTKAGDSVRLALTDDQLDEQFWLIDHEGIPRLKEDEGKFEYIPNPLLKIAGMIKDGPETNIAEEIDDLRREHFRRRFGD